MNVRRGAIMIEIVVSLALFVAAAGLTLSIARNVLGAIERSVAEQDAVDFAASRMAELEAGLIGITELRDGAVAETDDGPGVEPEAARWEIDVDTERTQWPGLTLVQLTVRPLDRGDGLEVTLRQLVRVRENDEEEYRLDEILEGLPE